MPPRVRAKPPVLAFRARIAMAGVNPYVLVSAARAAQLKAGWRRPMPVLVSVNGKPRPPWRINMMPVGEGAFRLYLHGDVRAASGSGVGDVVAVRVRFDDAYRGGPAHPMPPSFRAALARSAKARKAWGALTPSLQKEVLRYLAGLKSPEALARNVALAARVLSGRPGRFLGRSWNP